MALVTGLGGTWFGLEASGVTPRQLAPYLERRAEGHDGSIVRASAYAAATLQRLDRGDAGLPEGAPALTARRATDAVSPPVAARTVSVASMAALRAAIEGALPGDEIRILPGIYRIEGRGLSAARPGAPNQPIVVRGEEGAWPVLESRVQEAIRVVAPHWRFEGLAMRGACDDHSTCEHAFHVVGRGTAFVARNNRLADFNAHFKVNGEGGAFPDGGLVVGNVLTNEAPRRTDNPVTPIDLVAASGWRIEENLIVDFIRAGRDAVSYGIFAKGGAAGTVIARNVVLCESRLRGHPGSRVGLSFGGGGTSKDACRDRRCIVEHQGGEMRDNLIAGCSDEGIYLNRAADATIVDNTLIDTAGIEVRFPESSADVARNLVDGRIRVRDGALLRGDTDNATTPIAMLYLGRHPIRQLFVDWAAGDYRWRPDATVPRAAARDRGPDLCGADGPDRTLVGAFERFDRCRTR